MPHTVEFVFNLMGALTWRIHRLPSPTRINSSSPWVRESVHESVHLWVRPCLQIRYSAENGTSPTDSVKNHESTWIVNQKFSEIKYMSKSNTVNNMKLMILAEIREICMLCSSSPCAASVFLVHWAHHLSDDTVMVRRWFERRSTFRVFDAPPKNRTQRCATKRGQFMFIAVAAE